MKRFFSLYPELLLVDATYKLTNLRMPLYLLLVVGPNGESEIAAIFLTASEDCVSLSAMFEIFKEKNINWSKISSVFTYKDMTEHECIKHAFPQINLLLCIFHVLRCMSREITTSKMNISEAQRLVALKALQKMTYATTEKEYKKLRDEFHKVMPPPIVKYVEVNWHACRFEWVRCWQQQNITFGECTTNRLESINRRIKAVVSLLSSLPIFFKDLLTVIACMRQERDHKYITSTERVPVSAVASFQYERDYKDILTPFAFSFVKSQLDESVSIDWDLANEIIQTSEKSETRSENTCECLFTKSMGLPCKHMFAARRAKKLQMFSENCIAPRWFKETVQKNHRVFLTKEQHDSHIKFAKLKDKPLTHIKKYRRANRLVQHLSDLAAEGGSSQFECRMRVLQNLASIWGSNNEAMVTSIQHHFVDFNIQNGCSKLEIEDDIFRSELRERKFEMTDSSEEVVEVVNVEKNDKSNFDPNSKLNCFISNYSLKDQVAVVKLKAIQYKTL
nr:zinc finger SWIM domain-containing protein 1-like [Hydra vulgaris]